MMASQFVRSAYHRHPDPAYVGLCELAERVGAHVELDVSARAYGLPGHEYREVVALMIRPDDTLAADTRVTIRRGLADSLGTMAAAARSELEARL